MRNTSELSYCYGCGVCSIVCPKKIIDIQLDKKGFYRPVLNETDSCVECGLCLKVCAFANQETFAFSPQKSFAAWSNNDRVRQQCSSGGVGYEIGHVAIQDGGAVCGVRYVAEHERAEHFVASDEASLWQTVGSKYIQAYTVDGFEKILVREKTTSDHSLEQEPQSPIKIVVGTPCQIDSMRRLLRLRHKENSFLLVDFFCHGVPSALVWKNYCRMVEEKTGKIVAASWRNKDTGWHDSWAMKIEGLKSSYFVRLSQNDLFYRLFLGHFCMNRACVKNCRFKYDHSSADIRIGDLWGTAYANDEKGVSALVTFTSRGVDYVKRLQSSCSLTERDFAFVAEGQMKTNCKSNPLAFVASFFLSSYFPSFLRRQTMLWKGLVFLERIRLAIMRRFVR